MHFTLLCSFDLSPPIVKKQGVPNTACKLSDVACIIRSKNSGPFQITLDVLFDDEEHFERVRKADIFNSGVLAKLYQLKSQDLICTNMYFKPALAWKGTIVRPWAQGSIGERVSDSAWTLHGCRLKRLSGYFRNSAARASPQPRRSGSLKVQLL